MNLDLMRDLKGRPSVDAPSSKHAIEESANAAR